MSLGKVSFDQEKQELRDLSFLQAQGSVSAISVIMALN